MDPEPEHGHSSNLRRPKHDGQTSPEQDHVNDMTVWIAFEDAVRSRAIFTRAIAQREYSKEASTNSSCNDESLYQTVVGSRPSQGYKAGNVTPTSGNDDSSSTHVQFAAKDDVHPSHETNTTKHGPSQHNAGDETPSTNNPHFHSLTRSSSPILNDATYLRSQIDLMDAFKLDILNNRLMFARKALLKEADARIYDGEYIGRFNGFLDGMVERLAADGLIGSWDVAVWWVAKDERYRVHKQAMRRGTV